MKALIMLGFVLIYLGGACFTCIKHQPKEGKLQCFLTGVATILLGIAIVIIGIYIVF